MLELQEHAWKALASWTGKLPHALLLHGPRGVGKRALAEQFARLVLCERPASLGAGLPCGKCESCRWFKAGTHPDLRIVLPEILQRDSERMGDGPEQAGRTREPKKPSAEIKIEQVRALQDFVHVGSHRGNRRVVIVYPAEDTNAHAANALLKNLEEPPPAALFLLVSHRPWRLLPTVRSRCVPVEVPIPDSRASVEWLKVRGIRDAERWLRYCGGAPALALETASGELGEMIETHLARLAQGDCSGAPGVTKREHLEAFVDLLQKFALDKAFSAFGGRPKYGIAPAGAAGSEGLKWLSYSRELCGKRLVSGHPLNPGLFAAELISSIPRTGKPPE
jgi:DNA polymerase-3 subunit delta'